MFVATKLPSGRSGIGCHFYDVQDRNNLRSLSVLIYTCEATDRVIYT